MALVLALDVGGDVVEALEGILASVPDYFEASSWVVVLAAVER